MAQPGSLQVLNTSLKHFFTVLERAWSGAGDGTAQRPFLKCGMEDVTQSVWERYGAQAQAQSFHWCRRSLESP